MKVFSAKQIKAADQYTMEHEPIASIDLMERASMAFVNTFLETFSEKKTVKVFCGTGNNGGDGLAIARLLQKNGWKTYAYVIGDLEKGSEDFKANLKRYKNFKHVFIKEDFPKIDADDIVVDALFGSGLSRPVKGLPKAIIQYLNKHPAIKVSVDISSGLGVDRFMDGIKFETDFTFSFQFPKLSFFLSENAAYVGEWKVLDIGLSKEFIEREQTKFFYTSTEMGKLLPFRGTYTYKNAVGRLTIVAGSKGRMGASLLCAKAAFRSGVGIMEVNVPKCGTSVFQTSIPEVMVRECEHEEVISEIDPVQHTAAIGPGLGTSIETSRAIHEFLEKVSQPVVIDADGINILSKDPRQLRLIPPESILTPHMGEFKRMVGPWKDDLEKLEKLVALSQELKANIVLKGPNSAVCNARGEIHFNSTGNPVLATAGSGDVLTGIIASFLAQGLVPFDAARLGVYIHGLAGDLLAEVNPYGVMASDIVDAIPDAMQYLSQLDQ